MFEIQSRSGHWGWEAIEALRELGEDWEFETEAEAWEAIEALRGLSEEWAEAEFRVREVVR